MTVDESQLRAESDATLAALDTIRELERRKRGLPPESDDFLSSARQIRALTEVLQRTAIRQEELAEEVQAAARTTVAPDRPIVDVAPPENLPDILAAWRRAERRLAGAAPGSAEESDLKEAIRRLRRAYAAAHEKTTKGTTGLSD